MICFGCGRYCHRKERCPHGADVGTEYTKGAGIDSGEEIRLPNSDKTEAYGKWMLAKKTVRRKGKPEAKPDSMPEKGEVTMGNIMRNSGTEGIESLKILGANPFAALQKEHEEVTEDKQGHEQNLGDLQAQKESLAEKKETGGGGNAGVKFKEKFKAKKGASIAPEILKRNKGNKVAVEKNPQSVIIRKQGVSTSQRIANRGKLNVEFMGEQILRNNVSKVAAFSDMHVMVKGNNKTNTITRTSIPSTLPVMELGFTQTTNRAQLETFKDPSNPHPPKPNEPTCMELVSSTRQVHDNPIFDEHVSGTTEPPHMQPLGEVEAPTPINFS